jgi:hypothetical protein
MNLDIEAGRHISGLHADLNLPTHPPGWMHTGLQSLEVHILDKECTHRFDPNTVRNAADAETLGLGRPMGQSALSGRPAYLYRTHDLEIMLTKDEISRLVLYQLSPAEAAKLKTWFGEFFDDRTAADDLEGSSGGFGPDSERRMVHTGWVHTGLGTFQVHIVDGERTHRFDPNTVRRAAMDEALRLGSPLGLSDLSRQPAYLYRTHELQLLLTKGEISRLVLYRLHSTEVLKLRKRFGTFFEISDDFYHKVTGVHLA